MTRRAAETVFSDISGLNTDAPYVSDKLPFNYRYLGFISLFYPKARIIHCVRDPLDVCLSCYFARFRDQLSFSFNLTELGLYCHDYGRLTAHWSGVIANPMLEISYEKLVADQEGRVAEDARVLRARVGRSLPRFPPDGTSCVDRQQLAGPAADVRVVGGPLAKLRKASWAAHRRSGRRNRGTLR